MRRSLLAAALAITTLLALGPTAAAHPLGNFTANRAAEIVVEPGSVTIRYVLDLAEIPAYQTLRAFSANGAPAPPALQRWAGRSAAAIARGLVLRIDGRRSPLRLDGAEASVAPGQGGLSTLRLDAVFIAPLDVATGRLSFEDRNERERLGWREIVARGADGIELTGSTVAAVSVTRGLRSYPNDLLSSPLDVTSMEARFGPGSTATVVASSAGSTGAVPRAGLLDRLLVRRGTIVMLLGLLVALAVGAWHALLPGHGKTLMAAAVVGGEPRARDAVVAGASVAGMHTLSVILLGLAVVAVEQAFRPEAVYPWLRVASGIAAVAVGAGLLRRRWRSRRSPDAGYGDHGHGDHGHAHVHPHVVDAPARSFSRPGLAALALAGGILPSPSALLVLLASLQGGRAAYGLALVLSFSVGLAASLILVALGAMRARQLGERHAWGLVARILPIASASAVVAIGAVVAGGAIASL